jgi:predicted nucleotidyltransferase
MVETQTNLFIPQANFDYHVPREQIQFVVLGGSHSYGWYTEKSDVDLRVVYLPEFKEIINPFHAKGIKQYMENPPYDITTIPLNHFLSLIVRGNGNYLENLYMCKVLSNGDLDLMLKSIVGRHLHNGYLNHYLGYYSSLKKDLMNTTRLSKYGYEKLVMNAYRVLMTGIVLHDKHKVVFNLKELDRVFPETNCLNVLELYLSGKTVPKTERKFIDGDLILLEELLFALTKNKDLLENTDEFEEELVDLYQNIIDANQPSAEFY